MSVCCFVVFVFFFFKQKTAYEMRISDWSSDVCSSDLEQGKHYLFRFWQRLPDPGTIAIFDRSRYGRVLVERVEGLAPEADWRRAYDEINAFERMLRDDGVRIAKIFLHITADEQLDRRSEEHTSELQSLMRISYAVFCLKKKKPHPHQQRSNNKNNI